MVRLAWLANTYILSSKRSSMRTRMDRVSDSFVLGKNTWFSL